VTAAQVVNVGIIGGGLMGREIASAINRWPALIDHPARPRVTAVADINPAALSWFDQIDSVSTQVTDYRDLLSEPTVDVVYIAVRHDLHEQMYTDTIRAGKDLLAEKPFGIDLGAARRIVDAIDAHPSAFVRVSSEMPFFPGAQAALQFIGSGATGPVIEAYSAFLHSTDLDPNKPINWKRQQEFCGKAGVMNDLGLHAWHVPLRLGWMPSEVYALLQNLVPERRNAAGESVKCDTFENATVIATVEQEAGAFPLTVDMKRIAPGQKNSWVLSVKGMAGSCQFSTANPKEFSFLTTTAQPSLPTGLVGEQLWQTAQMGSQSVWPTVTGGIFESGFSDAILQMWAAFLAERAGKLGDRFGCATPEEALGTHRIFEAALASHGSHAAARPTPLNDDS
jgi:predicted dehydrogenase